MPPEERKPRELKRRVRERAVAGDMGGLGVSTPCWPACRRTPHCSSPVTLPGAASGQRLRRNCRWNNGRGAGRRVITAAEAEAENQQDVRVGGATGRDRERDSDRWVRRNWATQLRGGHAGLKSIGKGRCSAD